MKNNNAKKDTHFEHELAEIIKNLHTRFIKTSDEGRKEVLKRFDKAIETFPDSPDIRQLFVNLKTIFQKLAAKN